jgi:hypothetical protein
MGLLLLFIALTTIGSLIYGDISSLQNNFLKEPKLILVEDKQQFLVGMNITDFSFNYLEEPSAILTKDKLDRLGVFYQQKDLKGLLDGYYKVIIIKLEPIYDISPNDISLKEYLPSVSIDNQILEYILNRPMTKHYAYNILRSDNPIKLFVERNSDLPTGEKEDITKALTAIFNNSQRFKTTLAVIIVKKAFEAGGYASVIKQYKNGNILIYPENFVFKFAKQIPDSLTRGTIEKIKNSFSRR